MSVISETTIRAVNEHVDALAIVSDYVRLERRGNRYWGLCPFHSEKTASFTVDPEKRYYYCFGCGKGGGIINFLMEIEKINFPEAVRKLADRFGIPIQIEGGTNENKKESEKRDKSDAIAEIYKRVAGSFNHILMKNTHGEYAREYLKKRGINDTVIMNFTLGYAPADRSWLHTFLSKKGYSAAILAESGLFSRKYPKSSFFTNRLMFPIRDKNQRTIAFGGRILQGEGPKYINSAESFLYRKSDNLFALDLALPEIRRTKTVYLCEGYMDVIAMHQAGLISTVAPLGTAFTDDQARLLRRWADKVILAFDSDSAGINATIKAILNCRQMGLSCSVMSVKGEVKDPADILLHYGVEALHKTAECFINDFDFLTDLAGVRFDKNETEGLAQAIAFLFPYLKTLDSDIEREARIGKIADTFGVDRASINRDYMRFLDNGPIKYQNRTVAAEKITLNDELFLMTAVAFNRDLFRKLRSSISIDDLDNQNAKELYVALEECFRADIDSIDGLIEKIDNSALRTYILERGATDMFSANAEKLLDDGIARLKRRNLEKRRSDILIKMRNADKKEDGRILDDLLGEIQYIDAEIAGL